MPEENTNQEENEGSTEERRVAMKREDIEKLEAAAAKGAAAERLSIALAMTKAGIDTDAGLGKFFYDNYKGEPTKEAILAAASEIGLLGASNSGGSTNTPELTADEKNSTRERQQVATGGTPPGENSKHPRDEAMDNAYRIVKEGGTYEDAGAGYLSTLVQRLNDGDRRAVAGDNG